ncbi:MAG TPA: immunoglobulin domain-containing protein [Verrucomicrobiota bacterium]|nr:immunoglobulin domain-containing protein [Verrucomicrobiota bacterium]
MASNLTSGNGQSYEAPGIRILQGLKPDIVAMQEFKYNGSTSDTQLRQLVDTAFGTSFHYYREPGGYSIPNGIVSRWPIISSGTWEDVDPGVNDRGFAWARIDIPGTNDLYVVSIHLKASGGGDNVSRRNAQAINLVNLINANFPANAWIVVAGDCNIHDSSEGAYQHLASNFSDSPIPTDAETGGDPDTNEGRDERYDYVFPSQSLSGKLIATTIGSRTFPKGLVFDSAVYSPLNEVSPVLSGDSHMSGMQHMGVMRTFNVTYYVTNYVTNPPSIALHPQSQTVVRGNNATFTVTADGTAQLAYQWRFGSTNIAGATTTSFTRVNSQPADAGVYCVVVTNSAGSVTSSNATLTVIIPPAIVTQPSTQVVSLGANATFTVAADGTAPLAYQWRFGSTNIAGATTTSFTRMNSQPADAGVYCVVVTNSAGSVTSSNATLNIVVPPAIIAHPSAQAASQGTHATFTVVATGTDPLSYQWRFNATDLIGANASGYTRTNIQPADMGDYSVVISNAAGTATSSNASLTLIVPAPTLQMTSPEIIQWQGLSNFLYTVQANTNLQDTNWLNVGTASAPETSVSFTNQADAPQRFYRVVCP